MKSGHPPQSGRFRKGESGNPLGRPRNPKQQPTSAFEVLLGRTIPVTQDGQVRDFTLEELLQLKTFEDAIAGKRAAIREVLKMIMTRDEWMAAHAPRRPIPRYFEYEAENANEALLLLGIAERDTSPDSAGPGARLLLQPWATQKALSRPGRRKLSRHETSDIKRCTKEAKTLRWPASLKEGGDD
jgi:hypothetical protein